MRTGITVKLTDDGHELTFKITPMGALSQEAWIIDAVSAIAESGVLAADVGQLQNSMDALAVLGKALQQDGLAFLGRIKTSRVKQLLNELLEKCVVKVDGAAMRPMTPTEVDATICDLRTLFALQKEAVRANFGFLFAAVAAPSPATSASPVAAGSTGKPKISVRP